ncbi:MAG: amidohydrolase family protein [Xanthobacteraceae bacterium]
MSAMTTSTKTLVIRNGTLIDGSGKPSGRNEAIVIEGNKIKSVGALPPDIHLEDRKTVDVIDAAGRWVMPGLIDAHCHMSYGYPLIKGEGKGKGTTRPEFSTLKSARSAQKVLRSGVTSISVPGGTWFTDVGVRDAIKLGLMEGPRMFVAGRMIVTYGCIEDDEPSWEGTPDHSIGKLCNSTDEMVTEVRRQGKHGVNFIKMADSRSGESQMLAKEEIAAVAGEAHRRNLKVAIHSRGAGSTRAAAEAGVDWIVHADLATDRDLDAVAKAGMPILPTATFLAVVCELGKQQKVGAEQVQLDFNRMQRHYDLLGELMHKARKLGIRLLVGTDTGNNSFTRHGELHAKELEIFVKHGGYSPMEAIVAATRDNAMAVGLDGKVGQIAPDQLADITVWNKDPIVDIAILQDSKNLSFVVKDGKLVELYPRDEMLVFQQAAE